MQIIIEDPDRQKGGKTGTDTSGEKKSKLRLIHLARWVFPPCHEREEGGVSFCRFFSRWSAGGKRGGPWRKGEPCHGTWFAGTLHKWLQRKGGGKANLNTYEATGKAKEEKKLRLLQREPYSGQVDKKPAFG